MKWPTESKYHNRRVVVDGITFHSVKEAYRWQELKIRHDGKDGDV